MKYSRLQNSEGKTIQNLLIIYEDRQIKAISYDTEIATWNINEKRLDIFGYYSPTSSKHLNAFLQHIGIDRKLSTQDIKTTDVIQL